MLLCVFLFSVALFITTVIAKLLASYFHKQAFFDKMQATLTQVRGWMQGVPLSFSTLECMAQAAACVTVVVSSPGHPCQAYFTPSTVGSVSTLS